MMSDADFLSWGWRLPFLFSIVLLAVGLYIRTQISETPAFKRMKREGKTARMPVLEAIANHPKSILLGIGAKIAESGLYNVYAVFAITYAVTRLGLSRQVILYGVLVGAVCECITLPIFGALSDRIGRRTLYFSGMVFQALLAYPFFVLINTGNPFLVCVAIALGLALGHGSVYGGQGAFFSELFPARIRYSGLSLVQQIGPILGGGLSPIVATALLAAYGSLTMVIVYMIGMAVLSALCCLGLRSQTAHFEMQGVSMANTLVEKY